jgi:hypothetical protein
MLKTNGQTTSDESRTTARRQTHNEQYEFSLLGALSGKTGKIAAFSNIDVSLKFSFFSYI